MSTNTDASNDADKTVRHFADEILEQLLNDGKASDDLLNDYPNGYSWHHESHVDKDYNLHDAADVLDQFSDHEETNSGLWGGLEPRRAVAAMAAYTYGNAVYNEWREKIEQINQEAEMIIDDFDNQSRDLESEIADLNDQANGALAEDAERYRHDAEHKQLDLDGLDDKKKEALRKLIANVAGTP